MIVRIDRHFSREDTLVNPSSATNEDLGARPGKLVRAKFTTIIASTERFVCIGQDCISSSWAGRQVHRHNFSRGRNFYTSCHGLVLHVGIRSQADVASDGVVPAGSGIGVRIPAARGNQHVPHGYLGLVCFQWAKILDILSLNVHLCVIVPTLSLMRV